MRLAVNQFVPDICGFDAEIKLFGPDVGGNDLPDHMDDIRQRVLFFGQGHLAGFDAAHIQDIVDQRKEMFR